MEFNGIERKLEKLAQCCIDIAGKIISARRFPKPLTSYQAFIVLAEHGILPTGFAAAFASVAGFRNIPVHVYEEIDWTEVKSNLDRLGDFDFFISHVREYLKRP